MMLNAITSHEMARIRQHEIQQWVRQQNLLASAQGDKNHQAANRRERAGGMLKALTSWLRPQRRSPGGEALSHSNY